MKRSCLSSSIITSPRRTVDELLTALKELQYFLVSKRGKIKWQIRFYFHSNHFTAGLVLSAVHGPLFSVWSE